MLSYILRKQTNLKNLLIYLFVLCLFCGCKEKTGELKHNFSTPKKNISFSLPLKVNTEKLTTNDGLPDNNVCDIYQDKRGFIWFCTLNGLSKYDGNRFVNFKKQDDEEISLIDNRVKSVKEDRNDHLWILTSAELYSCLDLKNDRFVDYSGNGDLYSHYRKILFANNNDVWLWGSSDGCRKCTYNGESFVSYKFDKKRIGSNIVNCLFELPKNKVLIATDKALYLYDHGKLLRIKNNCNFVKIIKKNGNIYLLSDYGNCYELLPNFRLKQKIKSSSASQLSSNSGNFFIGNEWIVFTKNGGYSFDLASFIKKRLSGDLDIPNGMVIKTKKNLYIYNKTGCLRFVHNGKVKALQLIPKKKACYIDYERFHVVEDTNGLVWISTYGNGLFVYDWRKNETQHFIAKVNTDSPIASNCLLNVMEDRSGGIWVSSEFSGISHLWKVSEKGKQFFPFSSDDAESSNSIKMIKTRNDGSVEVSTRNGWLLRYNSNMTKVEEKRHFEKNIYSLLENGKETFIGTKGGGLLVNSKQYIKYGNNGDYSDDDVYCMLKDRNDNLWFGSFGGGLDLGIKSSDGYTFRSFFSNITGLKEVRCMLEDSKGRILLGTSGGLIVFNPKNLISNDKKYICYNSKNSNLPSDEIKSIMQDSKGRIWFAVTGSGIAWCDDLGIKKQKFNILNVYDGLVNDKVQSIVEDRQGNLWIATEYGISRLHRDNMKFENFFFSSFVLGNVNSEKSSVCLNNGNILFGTNYGIVMINPKTVRCENKKYTVTCTGLRINGIDTSPKDINSPLSKTLAYIKKIELKYNQNNFAIDFSTLDFPEKNAVKYSYKLCGYDKEWSKPSSLAFASYKNLPSGTYSLYVKACDFSGVWGEVSTIVIKVKSPWYFMWWAIILYIIIITCIAYFLARMIVKMNKLRNVVKVEKEVAKYKMAFFTNISHEFRTPLTLIRASLDRLKMIVKNDASKDIGDSLKIMEKSTVRMMRLIEQLLEYRKMQSNKLTLSLERVDVSKMIKDICSMFADKAKSNDIHFSFIDDESSVPFYVDKRHLDKIVYNLLSNAFKYTPEGGKITVRIVFDANNKKFYLIVADNGTGVPKDKQNRIFDSYMCGSKNNDSFGIGLCLTKSLVSISKGDISYKDNVGGGSVFTVELPTDSSIFNKNDFQKSGNEFKVATEVNNVNDECMIDADNEFLEKIKPYNTKKILIVEDNDDVRNFIIDILGRYFEVISEKNGSDGFTTAKSTDVDLIVSDVMMPGKNGFELTKRLKNDFETSHIPIILLTALDDEDSQLEGSQSGADAYVTKPFSMRLLLGRIFQLLNQREKLKLKFTNDVSVVDTSLCSSEQDQKFIRRMETIVDKQMGDFQFSVDKLSDMLNVRRTTFYKKVRGITGYTPNEYIRVVRLKKAAEMLSEGTYNVSEISYKVGFDNPFYFSKCFKAQFGVSPSQYRK